MARVATIVTSFDRLRNGKEVIAGDPALGYAANFLYTLTGKKPDDVMERVFDVALILHADHELNASTFAARVTAATLSDIYSAVTSAIGALKGPLHGGANEAVIQMLLKTNSSEDAVGKVKNDLDNKIKIPGFGHRVYHTVDPRAIHLKKMSEELAKRTGHGDLYEKSDARGADRAGPQKAERERRFLFGVDVLFTRHTSGFVYSHLRRKPHVRLDGAYSGAVPQQPPDPAKSRLHRRSGRAALDTGWTSAPKRNARS